MNLLCLVVDDEINSMGYLIRYIEQIPSLNLVKVTDQAQEAKSFLENNKIDLLITDIQMPHVSGLELYELFNTQCKLIFITGYTEKITEALLKNAIAVLPKPFSFELFEHAVEKANKIISFDKSAENDRFTNKNIEKLTHTQMEIFQLIGQNKTSHEIAEIKFISLKTVENHRQNIREKLNITGKHSLTLVATKYMNKLK